MVGKVYKAWNPDFQKPCKCQVEKAETGDPKSKLASKTSHIRELRA